MHLYSTLLTLQKSNQVLGEILTGEYTRFQRRNSTKLNMLPDRVNNTTAAKWIIRHKKR